MLVNRLSKPSSEHDANGRYGMIGRSPQMQKVYEAIEAVAPTSAPVLLTGETGAGKEKVARAIYENSAYSKIFVPLNCSAIPEGLLESEMFGHVRGAYTGAVGARKGRIEAAGGGTLFLDEVDEMSLALQPKFLRVLQEKEVTPVGANHSVSVNFRLIAATNGDLAYKTANKEFRPDLYYRLAVFEIKVPPLREREGDVDLLSDYFVGKYNQEFGLDVGGVSKDASKLLNEYHWKGNVRELEGVIHSAMIWKHYERSAHPNGRAEARLECGDIERVWNGRCGSMEPEPVKDIAVADFWADIAEPYKKHAITKAQVEYVIRTGLEYVGGNYAELVRYFKLPDSDYKRFMDFIRRHHVNADYRLYRKKG